MFYRFKESFFPWLPRELWAESSRPIKSFETLWVMLGYTNKLDLSWSAKQYLNWQRCFLPVTCDGCNEETWSDEWPSFRVCTCVRERVRKMQDAGGDWCSLIWWNRQWRWELPLTFHILSSVKHASFYFPDRRDNIVPFETPPDLGKVIQKSSHKKMFFLFILHTKILIEIDKESIFTWFHL